MLDCCSHPGGAEIGCLADVAVLFGTIVLVWSELNVLKFVPQDLLDAPILMLDPQSQNPM